MRSSNERLGRLARTTMALLLGLAVILSTGITDAQGKKKSRGSNYYGTFVGNFVSYAHNITGEVYVVDETTFFIKGFSYDGLAENAIFWVGKTDTAGPDGTPVYYPDPRTSEPKSLQRYVNEDIILKLPPHVKVRDIKNLSVWCSRFLIMYATVNIRSNLWIPQPRVLPEFSRLAHGLRSDNITILDSKTFYIPNLHYDGAGPDAYFWVGTGPAPHAHGTKVPNEVNSTQPLKGYEGVDIEIVLPGNLTVYDIDWLAMWCVRYQHNFGHVLIPSDLDVPPAVGQTKVATSTSASPMASNCIELLEGRVQVRWELQREDVLIKVSGRIQEDQYIAFGLSGSEGRANMLGADVVVVGYDRKSNSFIAEDYYMSDYAQCDGERGVCPDHRIGGKNDAVFVSGKRDNGITSVTYKRPLRTNELVYDKAIPEPGKEATVVAAIGQLNHNNEANAHRGFDKTTDDIRIDFGGLGIHQCTKSLHNLPSEPELKPWAPTRIVGENTFVARIGPTGGKRGYSRITGQPSWGIAWYINEMLIPEITVERGQNYTFVVEGGRDRTNPGRYHPLYITDNPEGGYGQLTEAQRKHHKLFAGVDFDENNYPYPTAEGRYCGYESKTTDQSAASETFEQFLQTLRLDCEEGEPGELVWHVAPDTPDYVYYQCYTHKNLGWKIKVVDPGYSLGAESGSEQSASSIVLALALVLFVSTKLR